MRYFICIFVILISFTSHAEDAERKLKAKSYHEVFTNYTAAAVGLINIVVNHNLCESKKELSNRKRKWKPKKINFGNGTLWKYAQTVGPAYLGAPTHPGGKKEVKCYADI